MNFVIEKAQRSKRKARIALIGPTGCGKTYTGLLIARGLVGPEGRICVIDTEKSADLYEDLTEYSVLKLDTHSPDTYSDAIKFVEKEGFDACIVDSWSHAWVGRSGALELVDRESAKTRGNSYVAWRPITPMINRMIDTMVYSDIHIITTMRAKMEYSQEKDSSGRTVIRKIGLQPVQRDGVEFEFDIVCDMDVDNTLVVSKTRCSLLSGEVIKKPTEDLGKTILAWLEKGKEPEKTVFAKKDDIDRFMKLYMGLSDTVIKKHRVPNIVSEYTDMERIPEERVLNGIKVLSGLIAKENKGKEKL